jgi:hypothetical protein
MFRNPKTAFAAYWISSALVLGALALILLMGWR